MEMFDYSKLRGAIREKTKTQEQFAKMLGISKGSLSAKLSGKSDFSHSQMYNSMKILNIDVKDLDEYFFKRKV